MTSVTLSKTFIRKNGVDPSDFVEEALVGEGYITIPQEDDPLPLHAHHYCVGRPMAQVELTARMVLPPAVTKPAVVPICCFENDRCCVEERILKVRNKMKPSGSLVRTMHAFITEMVDRIGRATLEPLCWEDGLALMPRQDRAALIEHKLLDASPMEMTHLSTFQKLEAYVDPKAPRNISPVPDIHLLESVCFTYVFDKALKAAGFAWYAPGRTPEAIAGQVARVTSHKCFGADYSKFDGHQNRHLRSIPASIIKHCFKEQHRAAWGKLFNAECNVRARTAHGVMYDAEGSMLSGSAITTIGNTLLNAFIYFASFRRALVPLGKCLDCLDHCILYGDDSAGPSAIESQFFSVCASLGIEASPEDTTYGLGFLGRIYFRAGNPVSIFDPRRIMPKLHMTVHPGPLAAAACNKAHGLKALCPGEFWITDVADRILRDHGNLAENESLWSSEDHFKRHLRRSEPLPPEFVEDAFQVACLLVGVSPEHWLEMLEVYKSDLPPPVAWINNGIMEASFPNTYVWDPYNSDFDQLLLPMKAED